MVIRRLSALLARRRRRGEILAKCEYANPGASVKDRAALYIVADAEERGLLLPGGTIVEGTAVILETELALPVLDDADIDWPKSGSCADKELDYDRSLENMRGNA